MSAKELKDKIVRYEAVLAKTTDEKERVTIQGVINRLQGELLKETTGKPPEPAPVEKPEKTKIKAKKEKVAKPKKEPKPKKIKVKVKLKKKEPKPVKTKVVVKIKKEEKPEKEEEKTVKVSKVIPDEEKKTVREVLEREHFNVIFKVVGGKKVKVTVKHSDRTVTKNKIESAFVTITKKVNSEDEKKKYAKDLQVVESMQKIVTELVERIYKAFNSHNAKELSAIARKLKNL
jgi:hypothetical protein